MTQQEEMGIWNTLKYQERSLKVYLFPIIQNKLAKKKTSSISTEDAFGDA